MRHRRFDASAEAWTGRFFIGVILWAVFLVLCSVWPADAHASTGGGFGLLGLWERIVGSAADIFWWAR